MTFTNLCVFNFPNTNFNIQSWTKTSGRDDASEAEQEAKCVLKFSIVKLLKCHNQSNR